MARLPRFAFIKGRVFQLTRGPIERHGDRSEVKLRLAYLGKVQGGDGVGDTGKAK
jgi:hypothetical protein